MKLHEVIEKEYEYSIMRVCGGWIYSYYIMKVDDEGIEYIDRCSQVFVPEEQSIINVAPYNKYFEPNLEPLKIEDPVPPPTIT